MPGNNPRGNPNWKKGSQGGGPKSSKLVIAARDPRMIDVIVGGYLQWRKSGVGVRRAENMIIREVLDVSTTTISTWRALAAEGKEPYRQVFSRLADTEKEWRQGLFATLEPRLQEQPFRYLEKCFVDWRDEHLNQEAVEARAHQIANDKLVMLAARIDKLTEKNPGLSAAELLTGALELLADQES